MQGCTAAPNYVTELQGCARDSETKKAAQPHAIFFKPESPIFCYPPPLIKRGQTCTFQTCTLFSARILALTASRLPSMPSFPPPLLSIASTLIQVKWAITSPKKGQATQRYHEEQSARSKGARLSALDLGSCGPGKLTEKGKFPKVLRGGCKRSFGPKEQRSPKSFCTTQNCFRTGAKWGFGWCKRLFGDLCSLGPKDLLHPPLSTFGNFPFSVNFPGPQLPNP